MAKRKNQRAKRSLGTLPKGLPHRGGKSNPFEISGRHNKRPKHEVHNRFLATPKSKEQTLESLSRRRKQLKMTLDQSKKANVFVDRRIGQYDAAMSKEDQMLARLVKERSRQSNRKAKFRLDDDENGNDIDNSAFLTHKGKPLTAEDMKRHVIDNDEEGSDIDDVDGNLAAIDTEFHFGGSGMVDPDPYGTGGNTDLADIYKQRKTELDDLIARRKMLKAEKVHIKETQNETVEQMDEHFSELNELLRYRKNEPPVVKVPTKEDEEMKEWQNEMQQMMMLPKKKATDRTKAPEEIAKEQAERLHKLETRRLARMNGDFEDDDLSDISVSEARKSRGSKKKKRVLGPDELSDSDDDSDDENKLEPRFTSDGLVFLNKMGEIVEKPGDEGDDASDSSSDESSEASSGAKSEHKNDDTPSNEEVETEHPLSVGTNVKGNYRAAEQFDGHESWFDGVVSQVYQQSDGTYTYDVEYDDGDFEEGMLQENVRAVEKSKEEKELDASRLMKSETDRLKKLKAKDKARSEIPYVFDVPTSLELLHDLIARYAKTGDDASTIIQRIYSTNSVRLNHRNSEKMQNFYDVLLRRFMAVGDAVCDMGDGGDELRRFDQLNILTQVMYSMAQDAPDTAGAVWSRRIGFMHNAHGKRLRDSEFVPVGGDDESLVTAWPSTGTFLLLRCLGHIFPVTDKKHHVVSPAILFLGQILSQTPIMSILDVVHGVLFSGLLLEFTKDAQRIAPEAMSFLASTIRLFSSNKEYYLPTPTVDIAMRMKVLPSLSRELLCYQETDVELPKLSLEKDKLLEDMPTTACALLSAALDLTLSVVDNLHGSFSVPCETEVFSEVADALLSLPSYKQCPRLQSKLAVTAETLANVCPRKRSPVSRIGEPTKAEKAIKTLAPRMMDPDRYTFSKDKGKQATQAALDRTRREYKREHKAISRELRLDASFIEAERREEQDKKDARARAKRQKNFAWLEGEQATLNQQVRQGGGLLKGGGVGLAKYKASTAKMGIKKGGRF